MMSELFWAVLGILLGLTFAFSRVTEQDFQKAIDVCAPNGGLEVYITNVVGGADVYCKNDAKFKMKEEK